MGFKARWTSVYSPALVVGTWKHYLTSLTFCLLLFFKDFNYLFIYLFIYEGGERLPMVGAEGAADSAEQGA